MKTVDKQLIGKIVHDTESIFILYGGVVLATILMYYGLGRPLEEFIIIRITAIWATSGIMFVIFGVAGYLYQQRKRATITNG
jgi:predicted alpha/beta-hydrolase family hydrolase